jgi:hypothetical protein
MRGIVGEERRSKEMDGYPLTFSTSNVGLTYKTIADKMPWCSAEDAKESLCCILSLCIAIVHVARRFRFGSLRAHSLA